VSADSVAPVIAADGVRVVSMDLLLEEGSPLAFRGPSADRFIWRGAMEAAALREFLADVAWGTLDILLVDLPPGLGRFEELADLLAAPPGVLTVTIPTPESRDAVRRALHAARARGAELLGLVENMVGDAFPGDAGAALAAEFGIPLLARLPFHPAPEAWESLAARL
jgi:ATP-binding protein involved in chromosome partitioning